MCCLYLWHTQEHRGLLSVRYPMEHGIVKDWNDMERIWQYVYSKEQLQTFSEEVWIEFIFILIVWIFTRIILVIILIMYSIY